MSTDQINYLHKIFEAEEQLSNLVVNYWKVYSFGSWQFWLHLSMLLIPLVLIYFLIDRKRAFEVGFYGFNVHVWFTYFDTIGVRKVLWYYPYPAIPLIPTSFPIDAALVPVSFMLLYQWTVKYKKNYYIYATLLSAFFAFLFKLLWTSLDLFHLYKNATSFHRFLGYLLVMLLSKWITNIFKRLKDKESSHELS